MRLSTIGVFASLGIWLAAAQSSIQDATALLPRCAGQCLLSALSESTCLPTNQTCICTDAKLMGSVKTCVLSSCSTKQALTTMNLTATACHAPVRDRSFEFNVVSITLGVISALFVVIRMVYHFFTPALKPGWEDWMIVITLIIGLCGNTINSVGFVANGLGKDVWTVSFAQLTAFIKWFYIQEILYFTQIATLKTSILFFYLRIFGRSSIRYAIIGTMALNGLYGVVFVFVAIFQCHPISYYWNKWHGEAHGSCLNVNAIVWANAAFSIMLDLGMLVLPLSQTKSLNMNWKRKVGVSLMFCVGIFVTIVSILRLQFLVVFSKTANPTWDQYNVAHWSTIEINVGIMCACMPAMRLVLVRFFPRLAGSSYRQSQHTGPQSWSQGVRRRLSTGKQLVIETVLGEGRETRIMTDDETESETQKRRGDGSSDYHDESNLVPMQNLDKVKS